MAQCGPGVLKTIRCIVCPTGCEIQVREINGEITYEGYTCNRGLEYAKDEFLAPKRILTTTMLVENGLLPLIPVRTNKPIPKQKLKEVLREIVKITLKAPIKMGDVLVENVLGLDANIIASRNLNSI